MHESSLFTFYHYYFHSYIFSFICLILLSYLKEYLKMNQVFYYFIIISWKNKTQEMKQRKYGIELWRDSEGFTRLLMMSCKLTRKSFNIPKTRPMNLIPNLCHKLLSFLYFIISIFNIFFVSRNIGRWIHYSIIL